jgi:hypothetical protein
MESLRLAKGCIYLLCKKVNAYSTNGNQVELHEFHNPFQSYSAQNLPIT